MSEPAKLPSFDRIFTWVAANSLLSAALAWLAFQLQQEGIAPAILFPLLVGAALGAGGTAIWRFTRWPKPRVVIAAAVVWGLLVVIGQDYIGHRRHLRLYDEAIDRQQSALAVLAAGDERMRPAFVEYLSGKVRGAPVWWCLDLALTTGAAVLTTALAARKKPVKNGEA
jgi:hypothetical protein